MQTASILISTHQIFGSVIGRRVVVAFGKLWKHSRNEIDAIEAEFLKLKSQ